MKVLIAGVSARAAADSAARAGFGVTALDAFGDLDQHPAVRTIRVQPFNAATVLKEAASLTFDASVYLSNLDNRPDAVRTLATGGALWGNSPAVLRRVRNPRLVCAALREHGFDTPRVFHAEAPAAGEGCGQLLVKPLASGGGHRVRNWQEGMPVPRRSYVQEYIHGTPGSVVFAAAGARAVPLGISRQLIGDPAFGSGGYRYCGSIMAPAGDVQFASDDSLAVRACALAQVVASAFGVVGLNGVDFVARDGVPYPIEINPRWSASMELVERAYGLSMFKMHAASCQTGALPDFDVLRARCGTRAVGKAIVFARRDLVVGNSAPWLSDGHMRDIPRRNERLRKGSPICTVFADAPDSTACYRALVVRAQYVYEQSDAWTVRIPNS